MTPETLNVWAALALLAIGFVSGACFRRDEVKHWRERAKKAEAEIAVAQGSLQTWRERYIAGGEHV